MVGEFSFQVGQEVEAKSFLKGYRGAWFRCKVEETAILYGRTRYRLNYVDFPDENMHWTQEFQVNPQTRRSAEKILERMIRPLPPAVVRKHTFDSGDYKKSTDIVVVTDTWKVGDLVDWWCNDCWWIATITKMIDSQTVEVSLPKSPMGEEGVYPAHLNALRPSFVWTEKHNWCTPTSQVLSSEGLQLSSAKIEVLNIKKQIGSSAIEESKVGNGECRLTTFEKEFETIADEKKAEQKSLPAWKELRSFVKGYVSIICEETSMPESSGKLHNDDVSSEKRLQREIEGSQELRLSSQKKRKVEILDS
ncbi:hypothetical protein O6H91_08G108300 [Diphasiastrum complanatum]|uniref:Uncharacterized protein n=1 Tax=Diphasiastrum complanatum TaxID=34168 RepID=A0ACC2D0V9_DIPCM|nr:hypothetical protein O6H91_08G108300 [Diphasiastrum complanatum]